MTLGVIVAGVSLLVLLGRVLYERWEPFYLWFNRARFSVTNPTALWNVEIDAEGEFEVVDLTSARDLLRKWYPDLQVRAESSASITVQAEGIVLDLNLERLQPSVGPENRYRRLVAHFHDVRAGYRESQELIDRISEIAEGLNELLHPESIKYSATIRFPNHNPYFGLYARRVRKKDVGSFRCVLKPEPSRPDKSEGRVIISKDSISISTRSQARWSRLSKKYLAVR